MTAPLHSGQNVGRNDSCPCGSGQKFKRCCGNPLRAQHGGEDQSDSPLLRAALAYAQRLGWPVFPCCWGTDEGACSCGRLDCGSPGKHPLTGQGFKEASRDEAQIRGWWTRWSAANIGIPTGQASGFDVLDIDPRHGGDISLEELEAKHGKLPATVEAITGGGGRHILLKHREGVRNATGFLPGLDVRGEGGYILVAPSNHHSGRQYAWELSSRPGEVKLAEWPSWLLELVQQPANGKPKGPAPAIEEVIPDGKRNETLMSLAGTMRRRGMSEAEILAALKVVNETRCQPPLLDGEVKKIAASIAHYEPAVLPGQEERKQSMAAPPAPSTFYRIQDGCLGYMKKLGRGDDATEIFSPLCNFTARVVEERTLDDGVEVKRRFVIEGQLAEGPSLPRAEISAAQFSAMRWPVDCWGVRARICAGMGAVDRLREAIQFFSADVLSRCAYIHTGWRKRNGAWHYLHAGLHDPEVLLEPPLNRYTLPVVPQDVPGALGHSLALLGVAPDTVTIPLLAMVYLAPLCEFLRPDFAVCLVGRTGSLKSTLAALFLSHYGNFPDKTTLPASWESTDNALERRLFILKDTLAVVDDYAPRADVYSQRRQAQRAQRIIRAMGNLSGRARLSGDLSERPEHPPRGLLLSTGEDLPPGQSILARILSVEVDRNRLNLPKLTESQHRADRLPHAIAGYIEWLAPQLDELAQVLPAQWREHRARFTQKAAHLRIPEILAYLALGIDLLTSFARDLGVLTPAQVRDLAERTRAALLTLGEAHGQRVKEEDPAEVFLSTFAAMLAQGAIRLDHKDRVGEANREIVGWKDGEYAYLIPDAARHAVGHYLQESGSHFPYSARALYEALDGRGALVKGVGERGTVAVRIGGKRRRVLQIPLTFLEPEEEGEAE